MSAQPKGMKRRFTGGRPFGCSGVWSEGVSGIVTALRCARLAQDRSNLVRAFLWQGKVPSSGCHICNLEYMFSTVQAS